MPLRLPPVLPLLPPALLLVHHISTLLVATSGPSMLPTIPLHSDLVLDRRASSLKNLRPGDVVAARSAWGAVGDQVVKRVLALEGDFVEVPASLSGPAVASSPLPSASAAVDGAGGMPEPEGVGSSEAGRTRMLRVPRGHVWLEGDNRPWSRDSRHYGPVPRAMVEGRAVAVRDARTSVFNLRAWRWVRGHEDMLALDEG